MCISSLLAHPWLSLVSRWQLWKTLLVQLQTKLQHLWTCLSEAHTCWGRGVRRLNFGRKRREGGLDVFGGHLPCLLPCSSPRLRPPCRVQGSAHCEMVEAVVCTSDLIPLPADSRGVASSRGFGGRVHRLPYARRWITPLHAGAVVPFLLPVAGGGQPATDTCVSIPPAGLRIASWNTRGLLGFTASPQRTREREHHCLQRLCDSSDTVCLQESHGNIEVLRALSTIHSQWHMAANFVEGNVNAGGSAKLIRKSLLQGGCVLRREGARVGRDHLITLSSGTGMFMLADVYTESNSTLQRKFWDILLSRRRSLLCSISNLFWWRPGTHCDFSLRVQPNYTRKDIPMAEARDFRCGAQTVEVTGSYRATTPRSVSRFRSEHLAHKSVAQSRVGSQNVPSFVQ